jgi:hypothetical protein
MVMVLYVLLGIRNHGGRRAVIAAFLFSLYDLSMACVSKLYALIPISWRRPAPAFSSGVLPLAIA